MADRKKNSTVSESRTDSAGNPLSTSSGKKTTSKESTKELIDLLDDNFEHIRIALNYEISQDSNRHPHNTGELRDYLTEIEVKKYENRLQLLESLHEEAKDALRKGQLVRFHEKVRNIHEELYEISQTDMSGVEE